MRLWLLTATALLSAVGASHLSGKVWKEANDQQDEGQDDYSDGAIQKFPAPQQEEGDDYDLAGLERYDSELPSDKESDFAGVQQDSGEDEPEGDLGEMQQDDYSDDEDEGELQQDEEDDDYGNELKALLQQEGDYDDEGDTEAMAEAAQEGDEKEGEDETAVVQRWNNWWDGPLYVRCRAGYGLYNVYSIFNAGKRDRLFKWHCKRVLPIRMINRVLRPILRRMKSRFLQQECRRKSWHAHVRYRRWYYKRVRRLRHYYYHRRYLRHTNCFVRRINRWDRPMNFRCPTHYYLTGLRSWHSNSKEDRVWNAYCCRTPGVCRTSCRWSGYVNRWRTPMRFRTGGVFTGLYSFHNNRMEDRLWKIQYCYSRAC